MKDAESGLIQAARGVLPWRSEAGRNRTLVRVSLVDRVVFDAEMPNGGAVVVKASWGGRQLEKESVVLKQASAGGVPVPSVLAYVRGSPTVLALSKVDGLSMAATQGAAPWYAVGRVLGRLHGMPVPPGIPRFDLRDADWAKFMRMWVHDAADRASKHGLISRRDDERLRSGFADHVSGMASPPRVLLHGDCQADHFLIADGSVAGVVDFGDARVGDPTWDIAVLTIENADRVDAVLRGYQPVPELRDHVKRWLPSYRLLRQLGAVCWRRENGLPYARELSEFEAQLSLARPWLPS